MALNDKLENKGSLILKTNTNEMIMKYSITKIRKFIIVVICKWGKQWMQSWKYQEEVYYFSC